MLRSHLQKLIQIRTKYFGNMFTPVCLEPRWCPNLHWTLKEGGWACICRCNEKQHEYRRKTLWNTINDGWITFLNPKMQKISILTQDDLTQKCYFFYCVFRKRTVGLLQFHLKSCCSAAGDSFHHGLCLTQGLAEAVGEIRAKHIHHIYIHL